jgi:RIO kinase 1
VLLGPDGPVIIDFPQAVDASKNQNARRLLLRDVDNLHRFHAGFAPESRSAPYAEEIWQLYERGELTPDVRLRGRYRRAEGAVDTASVLGLIADAEKDERKRRVNQGIGLRGISQPATSETRTQLPPQRRREEPVRTTSETRTQLPPQRRREEPVRTTNETRTQLPPQRRREEPVRTTSETRTQLPPQRRREEPVRSSELQAKHPKARTDTTSVSHQPPPPRSQSNQAAAPARDAPRASTELPQTNGSGVPSKASKRRRRRRRSQRTDAATTNANHPAPAQPSTRPRWQA